MRRLRLWPLAVNPLKKQLFSFQFLSELEMYGFFTVRACIYSFFIGLASGNFLIRRNLLWKSTTKQSVKKYKLKSSNKDKASAGGKELSLNAFLDF